MKVHEVKVHEVYENDTEFRNIQYNTFEKIRDQSLYDERLTIIMTQTFGENFEDMNSHQFFEYIDSREFANDFINLFCLYPWDDSFPQTSWYDLDDWDNWTDNANLYLCTEGWHHRYLTRLLVMSAMELALHRYRSWKKYMTASLLQKIVRMIELLGLGVVAFFIGKFVGLFICGVLYWTLSYIVGRPTEKTDEAANFLFNNLWKEIKYHRYNASELINRFHSIENEYKFPTIFFTLLTMLAAQIN